METTPGWLIAILQWSTIKLVVVAYASKLYASGRVSSGACALMGAMTWGSFPVLLTAFGAWKEGPSPLAFALLLALFSAAAAFWIPLVFRLLNSGGLLERLGSGRGKSGLSLMTHLFAVLAFSLAPGVLWRFSLPPWAFWTGTLGATILTFHLTLRVLVPTAIDLAARDSLSRDPQKE